MARRHWSTRCFASPGSSAPRSFMGERILDSNDLERERGITILAKNIAINYGDDQDQPDRHAGPRRLRRRGRAHASDGRRGARAGRRLRRADAPDQVRAPQGVRLPHPADRRDQQGRPPRRPAQRGARTRSSTLSSSWAPARNSSISPTSSPRARRASPRTTRTRASGDVSPLFDLIVDKRARPGGRPGRPVLDALHDARLLRVRRPDRHRPDRLGQGQARRRKPRCSRPAASAFAGSIDSVLLFDKLGRVEVEEAEAGDIVAIVGSADGRDRRHDRRARSDLGPAPHRGRRADL